LDCRLP